MAGHRSLVLGIVAVLGLACVEGLEENGLGEPGSAPPPLEHEVEGQHSGFLAENICQAEDGEVLVCSGDPPHRDSCFVNLGGERLHKETAQTFIAPRGGPPGKLRAVMTLRNPPEVPPVGDSGFWRVNVEIRRLDNGSIPLTNDLTIARGNVRVESCDSPTAVPGRCLDYMEDLPVEVTLTWGQHFVAGESYAAVFSIERSDVQSSGIALGINCHNDNGSYPDGMAHHRTTRRILDNGDEVVYDNPSFVPYNRDLYFSVSILDGCEDSVRNCGLGMCRVEDVPYCDDGIPIQCSDVEISPLDEICDGLDQDCDGIIDNMSRFSDEKLHRACYTGPEGTRGVGACQDGVQACNAEPGSGVESWAECLYEVHPSAESCNGIDDDCDGFIDNAMPGSPEKISRHCYTGPPETEGVGECRGGLQYCDSTVPGVESYAETCVGQVLPGVEICDGLDNNCDGQTDEGNPGDGMGREGGAPCVVPGKLGVCAIGTWQCIGGGLECVSLYEPGPEVCDGLDNDCDGFIDNVETGHPAKITETCYEGPEGTAGVGVCRTGIKTCASESAGVEGEAVWSECHGQVLPEEEVCDGLDNNCDGYTDNYAANPDDSSAKLTRICYTGPAGTQGVGICHAGIETCNSIVEGVESWSSCVGEQTPLPEVCDGFDNDCDGFIDNHFTGLDNPIQVQCYTGPEGTKGVGECSGGLKTCTATPGSGVATYGACEGEVTPKQETCNGRDDDCDGFTDNHTYKVEEKILESCYDGPAETRGVGICTDGWRQCNSTEKGVEQWTSCNDQVLPMAAEICNGLDDNCDGEVDEGDPGGGGDCHTGRFGECGPGTEQCIDGSVQCVPHQLDGKEEICDGLDNDCDGLIDNFAFGVDRPLEQACYDGPEGSENVGECRGGVELCVDGEWSGECLGQVLPTPEVCDNRDNNCDGITDRFEEHCYEGEPGTEGVGECKGGQRFCTGGIWGVCVGQILPAEEVCDGKDNSCNGLVDAEDPDLYVVLCEKQQGVCAGARKTINHCTDGSWDPCTDADYAAHSPHYHPTLDICDGLDNNCDGQVDEAEALDTVFCEKQNGVCLNQDGSPIVKPASLCDGANGWKACGDDIYEAHATQVWGIPGFPSPYNPNVEYCDGLDNNCDGSVDEPVRLETVLCEMQEGVCAGSTKPASLCVNGVWGSCNTAVYQSHSQFFAETEDNALCDGRDNDCDGRVDNLRGTSTKLSRECYEGPPGTRGKGECQDGTQVCEVTVVGQERWGSCNGQVLPADKEICDGKDNTCNGLVDTADPELDIPFCEKTQGVCAGSRKPLSLCRGSAGWDACTDTVYSTYATSKGWTYHPTMEFCDLQDNNCNGQVDEHGSLEQVACQNPVNGGPTLHGVCQGAIRPAARCQNGHWQACTTQDFQAHSPHYQVDETNAFCDGLDNDCDGRVDNIKNTHTLLNQACWTGDINKRGKGECRDGGQQCIAPIAPDRHTPSAPEWSACTGEIGPSPEICDGKDNDCDGRTDNMPGSTAALTRSCYTGPAGTAGRGICKAGSQTCNSIVEGVESWTSCVGEQTPQTEVCDGLDNNCDGHTDNMQGNDWKTLCPNLANNAGVTMAACDSAAKTCFATQCGGDYFHSGGTRATSNNCACNDSDGFSGSCSSPTSVGTVNIGAGVQRTGRVKVKHGGSVDASGGTSNSDFFQVTYNLQNDANPGGYRQRLRGSPRVRLTNNPGNAFRLRVRPGNTCSGLQQCNQLKGLSPSQTKGWSASGRAENITEWTHSDLCRIHSTSTSRSCANIGYRPTSGNTRPASGAWPVVVEVYRMASTQACDQYTVVFDYLQDAEPDDMPALSCTSTRAELATSATGGSLTSNLGYPAGTTPVTLYSRQRVRNGNLRILHTDNVPRSSGASFAQYANEHWFRVVLPNGTHEGRSARFGNLRIRFTVNDNDAYRFRVHGIDGGSSSCTAAMSVCGAPANGLVTYEWTCPAANGCSNGARSLPTQFYIRVFRNPAQVMSTAAISARSYRLEVRRTHRGRAF